MYTYCMFVMGKIIMHALNFDWVTETHNIWDKTFHSATIDENRKVAFFIDPTQIIYNNYNQILDL